MVLDNKQFDAQFRSSADMPGGRNRCAGSTWGNKVKYLGLNLFAPGIAQFALRWWIRGALQFGGAVLCFCICLWTVIAPLYHNIQNALNGVDKDFEKVNLILFFYFLLLLIALWGWSLADVLIFYKNPVENKEVLNEENGPESE